MVCGSQTQFKRILNIGTDNCWYTIENERKSLPVSEKYDDFNKYIRNLPLSRQLTRTKGITNDVDRDIDSVKLATTMSDNKK